MDTLKWVVFFVFAAYFVASIALILYDKRREYKLIGQVWRRYRFGMLIQTISVLFVVLGAFFVLYQLPGLQYGWLHLFYAGGGNILVTPVYEGSKTSNEIVKLLPILFFAILLFIVPILAKVEEEIFRKGYRTWDQIVKQSIKFGLMHCIVGIPVAAAIALIIAGLWYGYQYKKTFDRRKWRVGREKAEEEAVMVSTVYHSLWNTVALGTLSLALLVDWIYKAL